MPLKSAFIAGAARNCATGLPSTLARLERLQASFNPVKFVIVTNDSTDGTDAILRDWARAQPDAHIVSLDGLANIVRSRTARLAIARSAYLSVFEEDLRKGRKHDLLVVADLDGLNAGLVEEPEFSTAIESAPANWAGIFANSRGIYYDIWALRHPTWSPDDCWQQVRKSKRRLFGRKAAKAAAIKEYIHKRQIVVDPSLPPIPVESAFGGFGIYRAEAVRGATYVGLDPSGGELCEHVAFNEAIRGAGGSLYIIPSLLTDTHP
jgi:hypothetical protein